MLEYPEKPWRTEETCFYSDFNRKLPVKTGVKYSLGVTSWEKLNLF